MKMENETMKILPAIRTEFVQEYYFSRKLKEIEEMRKNGADIINLGTGGPDLPPSLNTIEKLVNSARQPGNHGYQNYIGIPELRQAYSLWYKKYFRVDLNPQNEILPLIGSKEGIMHISMAFLNPGEEVLIPNPGYPAYAAVVKLLGCVIKYYDLTAENQWIPDLDRIEKNGVAKVKMMWINYPHMPSGTKGNKQFFKKIITFALKHKILICNDNPYSFILNDELISILSIDGAMDVALELNSLSKSHNMAGWRMGLVAGNAEYIKSILEIKSNMDSGMFLPLQLAAVEALDNTENWYRGMNDEYRKRRVIVEEILAIMNCTYDRNQVGLFVWAKIPSNYSQAEHFTDEIFYNTKVFITPGSVFGNNGDQYIRISLCCNEEMILKAKERISQFEKSKCKIS
ncbi:MAG: aminotransferase class I/II-fold pyridoxal phosphate-dependent enzyme [Bacteroidales bacterium]|nr:aminotransferase class I/II-fold pyridoxal phosphate-dependent enzyme [Bacteroidales bacterium]